MDYLPTYFYSKVIRNALDELIIDEDKRKFSQLTLLDKEKLSGIFIKAICMSSEFRGDETCCITESAHADQTMNMFAAYLINGEISKDDFLDTIKENTVNYFEDRMQLVFESRVDEINLENLEEKGLVSRRSEDNGEYYWIPS